MLKLSAEPDDKNAPLAIFRFGEGRICVTVYHVNPTTRMCKTMGENELTIHTAVQQRLNSPKKLLQALLRLVTPDLVAHLQS